MLIWIIAAEIAFWIVIIAGLFTRYILKLKKLSIVFFLLTPFIDLALLILTAIDLKNGATATTAHGVAAIYIGVSIAYGKSMITWADSKFQSWVLKVPSMKKVLFGKEKAKYEMKMWFRHLLSYVIGGSLLGLMILYVGEGANALFQVLRVWTVVLIIDLIISFSYLIFPKNEGVKE